jgi:uncharacterized protein
MNKTESNKIDRRMFLKTTGMAGASMAMTTGLIKNAFSSEAGTGNTPRKIPTRILGKTGTPVTILALGGGVDWTINQTLLRMAINMGINCLDTAHDYLNGKSEMGIGQYLEKYPEDRKKIFICSKSEAAEPNGITDQLNASFERMKTDYIDLYGLHMVDRPERLTSEIKAWAEQKKREGKIKYFGFSCHSNMAQMLSYASKLGWIDIITSSYNYNLMNNDALKRGIDECYRSGIGLIAMKSQGLFFDKPYDPLGTVKDEDLKVTESFMKKGYTLQQAKLKAVWAEEKISTCLSEVKNLTMLKDNVAAATDNVQLSKGEMDMLNRLSHISRDFYCQGCMKCKSAMASESRINDILRFMMYYNSYGERDEARRLFRELPEEIKRNIASNDYSSAERICPHNIKIGKAMREAARVLA